MQTRRLRTIMISAYLSTMLTSSVAPIRRDVALAGTIDSTAALQSLRSAIDELNAGGWGASVYMPANVVPPAAAMPAIPATQVPEPIISEELMARLIRRALASVKVAPMDAQVCAIFAMCDGSSDLPVRQIAATKPDGKHYVQVPLKVDSKDIVVSFKHDDVIEYYLTDKRGNLRAAAVSDAAGRGLHLITNEQAAEKFAAEMQSMAKLAEGLPPTGEAVAGNS